MAPTFELTRNDKGEFYFKLQANAGGTLLRSEGYNAKASASKGIDSVRRNASDDDRYELKTASDGRPFFNLKASNGQVVGTSPMFQDEDARSAAIAEVRTGAAAANVVDKT